MSTAAHTGQIFNIQGFSIHDGPGIRSTVFLKGCPLRCDWCQNPESQQTQTEILFLADKCDGCGKCVAACAGGAISLIGGSVRTGRGRCGAQGACVTACPAGARELIGRQTTAEDIVAEVLKDSAFYASSGGGVTLSGGEPLFHPTFAAEILRLCKIAGLHTTLDTCGYATWTKALRVLRYVDLVLYDFKHMDSEQHLRGTGVPNELILDNARRIHHELRIPIFARVPVLPGFNDSDENMSATARFIATELHSSVPVHLIGFHGFGEGKRARLERAPMSLSLTAPDQAKLQHIQEIFASCGLQTVIGG